MSLVVNVTVTGSEQVRRKMKRLGSSLYDFSTAMSDIGQQGTHYFSTTAWYSQGGVFGNKWAPLAASTTRYRNRRASLGASGGGRRASTGAQPLTTGNANGMQSSFIYESNKTGVTIGNSKSYFKYHQSNKPRKRLPRRQMIGASTGFRTIVRNIIKQDIQDKIRRA